MQKIAYLLRVLVVGILMLGAISAATFAWYAVRAGTAAYVPVFSPEALYIGAGHRDIDEDTFEDIRYLYFNGLDAEGEDHVDNTSNAPFGILPPRSVYFAGFFRNSTISCTSCLAPICPATSLNVTPTLFSLP